MKRVLVFVILLSFTFLIFKESTLAEGNTVDVEYNARTNKFSIEENQDLFVDLKNVVPGDNLTQKVNLKVINLKSEATVKIYLQAENPNDDYSVLTNLNGVKLTVNTNAESIEEEINTPLLLGYFSENNDVNIDVYLTVDKAVGNEISNLNAEIDWIFSAEIIEGTDMPKMGDSFNGGGVVITCIISLGFICLITMLKKRK